MILVIIMALCISACDAGVEDITVDSDYQSIWEAESAVDADEKICPEGMVVAGSICIDQYEASRIDATSAEQGTSTEGSRSVAGVIPWHVNPLTDEAVALFHASCQARGAHLCTSQEWVDVCRGSEGFVYSYGNTFDAEVCNCVDSFCKKYCSENSIPDDQCNTSPDCGYNCGVYGSSEHCFRVMPTGSFEQCVSTSKTFDHSGNVWEVVRTPVGYEVRGGAFNCASASNRLQCTYVATWKALYAGFRCCADRLN